MYPVDLLKVGTRPVLYLSHPSNQALVADPDAGRQPFAYRYLQRRIERHDHHHARRGDQNALERNIKRNNRGRSVARGGSFARIKITAT